jgi:hypothetical protein
VLFLQFQKRNTLLSYHGQQELADLDLQIDNAINTRR